jgi:protein-disulfide isomerase|tara:strand:+ start:182 stop:838 length:657 start_codon:yes stop_codon:yes gene_type:complete
MTINLDEQRIAVTIKESSLEKLKVFGDEKDDWDKIINNALSIIQNSSSNIDDPFLGVKDAPVTILEFSDFECYYCMEVLPVIKKILQMYKGKIKVVFKNFPRTLKHFNATNAHVAALCAKNQGKFWEFHDQLFKNMNNLKPDIIIQIAEDLGLDVTSFNKCQNNEELLLKIFKDKEEGNILGVRRVPTFFVNGLKIEGSASFDQFAICIDKVLNNSNK